MDNRNLSAAKDVKFDEWYTQLSDIEAELNNYTDKFKGKVVFCNCDDPFESNFVKFFLMNFNRLKLKKLIATGYKTSPIGGTEIGKINCPYVLKVSDTKKYLVGTQSDLDAEGARSFLEEEGKNIMTPLMGDFEHEPGDFQSFESIDLLRQSDIVCTNPPYSLLSEYIAQLKQYNKQFLIIVNQNALTYKEVFPEIKDNRMWLGASDCVRWFIVTGDVNKKTKLNRAGQRIAEGARSRWLTNLDHPKRHQIVPLDFGYRYKNHEDMYPKYDNYDAIDIGKVRPDGKRIGDADYIPCDYKGVMGVPITFLDKYCPEQFEIVGADEAEGVGFSNGLFVEGSKPKQCIVLNQRLFKRLFIRFTESYIASHPQQFVEEE